jgi:2,3,4,5-tetrahydropyridine-2,6-dicarboxylate N-succinyltransferase
MRRFLLSAVAALATVSAVPIASAQTLKVVMHSDVKVLDPIWSGAYITRNHGYMLYDVLFAMDEKFQVKPQMVDTWTTVGSCAQIGKHCHLSGGAGIGGVLEPLQASPTIIEDHCFIGARSEVVEGFVVGHHSVIGMGVFLGQSTRIYDRATGEVSYGRVPPYSVVVSGQLPAKDGSHSLYCAVIVKRVDARTRSKTSINELLRGLAE